MKALILQFTFLFFLSFASLGQDKIGNKIYSYGDIEHSVKGKTLIHYLVNDPQGEIEIIEYLKDYGIKALSWNKLFIPDYKYSDSEINAAISLKNIQTIITIRLDDVSTYNVGGSFFSPFSRRSRRFTNLWL